LQTDPKNTDYAAEHGAVRNFEPWRDDGSTAETAEERLERLANEAAEDPMEELEKKTVDQKREMDILDKLQEVRQRNARLERADVDRALNSVSSRVAMPSADYDADDSAEAKRRAEEAEDEAEVRRRFGRLPPSIELEEPVDDEASVPEGTDGGTPPAPVVRAPTVKRKLEDAEPDPLSVLSASAKAMATSVNFQAPAPKPAVPLFAAAATGPAKKKKVGGMLLPGIKAKGKA
jgi:hypothetical protein